MPLYKQNNALIKCDRCASLQKSADLLKELHAVVGQHADSIDSQQSEICRLESEAGELLRSRASVQKERDDALDETKHLQRLNEQLVAQHSLDVCGRPYMASHLKGGGGPGWCDNV